MNKNLFEKIYSLVKKIPRGKITTYGTIAKALGISDSRVVGWALHGNKSSKVPCHRVVNKEGGLAKGYAFGGWQKQKARLAKEGVNFSGQKTVNLEKSGYFFKLASPARK